MVMPAGPGPAALPPPPVAPPAPPPQPGVFVPINVVPPPPIDLQLRAHVAPPGGPGPVAPPPAPAPAVIHANGNGHWLLIAIFAVALVGLIASLVGNGALLLAVKDTAKQEHVVDMVVAMKNMSDNTQKVVDGVNTLSAKVSSVEGKVDILGKAALADKKRDEKIAAEIKAMKGDVEAGKKTGHSILKLLKEMSKEKVEVKVEPAQAAVLAPAAAPSRSGTSWVEIVAEYGKKGGE